MLLPKEKPFIEGLNSYYLHLSRLIEHMQGEIGCGCIHGKAAACEILVFFDENEIIRSLIKEGKGQPQTFSGMDEVERAASENSFVVDIFTLDQNAIFFWGQMSFFHWAKSTLRSSELPLPDLIFRLRQKLFSGFIEVTVSSGLEESGILFFHEGTRVGGSYSWGFGGMSKDDDDYTMLLSKVQESEGVFSFATFILDTVSDQPVAEKLDEHFFAPPDQTF